MRKAIALAAGLAILAVANHSIYSRERLLADGRIALLELAPVDPRSLMQGDYMALRFEIADHISTERSGSALLQLDSRGVATLHPDQAGPGLRIRYRIRNGRVWLGTNAYFFEEGTASRYDGAKYGEFRVDPVSGEAVLVGLADETLSDLGRARRQ